jgi:hypothetical protein
MKNLYPLISVSVMCLFVFLISCRKGNQSEINAPEDDKITYMAFELQSIDSVRYWGDSEKIRLLSGVIMLRPDNQTYLKKFTGTGDEALDPAQMKWSKEETGKYSFSKDSTRILFSNDPRDVFYFPGNWSNGIYFPTRLEQHDSLWYSISYFSMSVSGWFEYSGKPD